jgi:hypothetical protein
MIGIYRATNTITGECYVGQSRDIDKRWKIHLNRLHLGKHDCKAFQASFNQHGPSAFVWDVLEECHPSDLDLKEKQWMAKIRPALNTLKLEYSLLAKGYQPGQLSLIVPATPPAKPTGIDKCETCDDWRMEGERFCGVCRDLYIQKMRRDKYRPRRRFYRSWNNS